MGLGSDDVGAVVVADMMSRGQSEERGESEIYRSKISIRDRPECMISKSRWGYNLRNGRI